MVFVVKYPITVHVDNVGAIFLSENTSVYQKTTHIDVRHHFIRGYVEDVSVKIKFVHSEENLAYPFTKDLSNGTFEYLKSMYANHK